MAGIAGASRCTSFRWRQPELKLTVDDRLLRSFFAAVTRACSRDPSRLIFVPTNRIHLEQASAQAPSM